jgi:CO/xanthine dehydrogenase Mo-binding subunit
MERRAQAVGASVPRKEDRPLLTGESVFVDDIDLPGAAEAAIVRSPHAHARVIGIDATAAGCSPGVIDVITASDVSAAARIPMRMYRREGMERFLQPPLAIDRVRYSGDPVAMVLADSRYQAEDAAELVEVAYEPLPGVLDPEAALEPEAPVLFPEADGNLAAEFSIESGDVEAAFAAAEHVVEERLVCQRHAAVPLETRGVVAAVDPGSGLLTVWGAAKVVHVNRRILAALLDWPEERIRLVELHVGGGFGARGEFYPEDYLVPAAAIRIGRPVKWIEDREENLRACNHSREQVHEIAIALGADGEFLALRDAVTFNTGAYVRTHGVVVPNMTAALLPGPYRWSGYRCAVRHVVTNKTPGGTYRAPGRFEANFARERIIDLAARRIGIDAIELRRRNLIAPAEMPYERGTHTDGHPVVFDSGDYPRLLEAGLRQFRYGEMTRWRERSEDPGRRRGIGVALFVEKSGIANWDYARVELTGGGEFVVHVGSASIGQGVETVHAQICADALGVPYERIAAVRHGDTDDVPDGVGSFGSRATMIAGSAVAEAAASLRVSILARAAELLGAEPEDLDLDGDRVAARSLPERAVALRELATGAGVSAEARFHSDAMSFPYGLHCAAVEVDAETGAVAIERYAVAYDVGRAINPALVEGQIVGGATQGIGGALLEELTYDADGQLVAGSFMDYLLPTAVEAPGIEVLITEDAPTPLTPMGAKGAGEGGTAAAGAAIANAVSDAVGAEVRELPITPERVVALVSRVDHATPHAAATG